MMSGCVISMYRRACSRVWPTARVIASTRTNSGRTAVLLDGNLGPIELEDVRRSEILGRVGQVQRQCQIRSALPPEPGDPPTLTGRIEGIEQGLAGKPGAPDLRRLYDQAWRLIWDSNDADVADRALDARDAIAQLLGPSATFAVLRDCRRYARADA